jgi:four helix bundle protein
MDYPTYRDLKASQKAMELVTVVYASTQKFPKEKTYGLTSQMRRAAVSIPSNIAEGQGRRLEGDFQHFLRNGRGSLLELETQILIARNLRYLGEGDAEALLAMCAEVGRILNGLIGSVRR